MKVLMAALVFGMVSAQASSIKSIDECSVKLARKYYRSLKLENSRISGSEALNMTKSLMDKSETTVEVEKDVLGVQRYQVITHREVLESSGDIEMCSGLYTAAKVDICTINNAQDAACETFCKIDWQGQNCM